MLEWRITSTVFVAIAMAGFLVVSARADVEDYCAAVARDFADLRPADRDVWQKRYDDASRDCINDFGSAAVAQAPKGEAKPAIVKPKSKEAAVSAPDPTPADQKTADKTKKKIKTTKAPKVAATADTTAKAPPSKPSLIQGTPEWLDYCARKYSSFNREKGTYTSRTGVERKCLVTADFN